MEVIIIAAVSENNVIGNENDIPWKLPSDLKQFKARTIGHPMIMGRKTWESFGSRPLPKRPHFVISSIEMEFQHEGVYHAFNLESAILKARVLCPDKDVYIIGGQMIYQQSMNLADRMFLSHIDLQVEGDRFFPEIDSKIWKQVSQVNFKDDNHPFTVVEYVHCRLPDGDF